MDVFTLRRLAFQQQGTKTIVRRVTSHQVFFADRLMMSFSQGQGSVGSMTHDDGTDEFVFGVTPMDATVTVGGDF